MAKLNHFCSGKQLVLTHSLFSILYLSLQTGTHRMGITALRFVNLLANFPVQPKCSVFIQNISLSFSQTEIHIENVQLAVPTFRPCYINYSLQTLHYFLRSKKHFAPQLPLTQNKKLLLYPNKRHLHRSLNIELE